MPVLADVGFEVTYPEGAYYVMAGIRNISALDDKVFAIHLIETVGIATVPRSSFYADSIDGAGLVRFAFCKRMETLETAAKLLRSLRSGCGLPRNLL